MKEDIEKLTDGIIFIGTTAIVSMVGFTLLSFVSEMWLPLLIVFPILYIFYRWLGFVLTGILFYIVILAYILLPILLTQ